MTHPPLLIESWLPIAAIGAESQQRARRIERTPAALLPARLVGAPAADNQPRGHPCRRAARLVGGLAGSVTREVP